jgi:hypothetical protein
LAVDSAKPDETTARHEAAVEQTSTETSEPDESCVGPGVELQF